MSDEHQRADKRTVEEETVNAYRVQRLSDGTIRIRSGGHVVHGPTYPEALERYAQSEYERMMDSPEHLLEDKKKSIYDGVIELKTMSSNGFTAEEILEMVTGKPIDSPFINLLFDFDDRQTFHAAEREWGPEAQQEMAEEEAIEFLMASKHLARGKVDEEDLIEEIADVRIMVEQLRLFFGPTEVDEMVGQKMDRLRARLAECGVEEFSEYADD